MQAFDSFIQIVKQLRAPDGCEWDKAQTYESLTPHIIEEAYELVDAMEKEDYPLLKEELGDVLLHVVMLANMADENDKFTVEDVVQSVSDKMIRRHPHVFGDKKAHTVEDVWKNWDAVKAQEANNIGKSPFDSIPKTFPALLKAAKVQKKASRMGYDWKSIDGPLQKLDEEVQELLDEYRSETPSQDRIEDEAGDLLFVVTNLVRKMGVNPEDALRRSNDKFVSRMETVLSLADSREMTLDELTESEMDSLWEDAKVQLRTKVKKG
jgi:MazG family protein